MKANRFTKTILRKQYLNRMIELTDTPDIKIITGIRRSGKSHLMQAYIEYLRNHFDDVNLIFINYMDLAFEEIKEYHALHNYITVPVFPFSFEEYCEYYNDIKDRERLFEDYSVNGGLAGS